MLIQHNKVMFRNPQLESSFNKTLKVIQSCTSKEQLKGASRMISNFKSLYGKVGYMKLLNYKLDNTLKKQYIIIRCQI